VRLALVVVAACLLAGCTSPAQPLAAPGGPVRLVALAAACNEDRDLPREVVVEVRLEDAQGNDTRANGTLELTVERSSDLGWRYVGSQRKDVQPGDFHALPGLTYLESVFDDGDMPGDGTYRAQVAFRMAGSALTGTTGSFAYDHDPAKAWAC
jgi:hypothetical protein